eukprot:g15068.t1
MASADRDVLEALFRSTDGDGWDRKTNWVTDADLSTWYGVLVDEDGRVKQLSLPDNSLKGPIPEALGSLSSLSQLDLSGNQLSGPIPEVLASLANLSKLVLGRNKLTGPIPEALGALANLSQLDLSGNQLQGTVPLSVWKVPGTKQLDVSDNLLTHLSGEQTENGPLLCNVLASDPVARSIKMGRWDRTPEVDENSRTTVGVDLHNHRLRNGAECKIFDVAGQITYYGFHQLFLTERAVYVVVWDATKFEGLSGRDLDEAIEDNILEWVSLIHMRAPLCTVMLVATHVDLLHGAPEENKQVLLAVEQRFLELHEEWKRLRDGQSTSMDARMTILPGVFPMACKMATESASHTALDGLQAIEDALSKKSVISSVPPSWVAAWQVLEQVGNAHDESFGGTATVDGRRRPWELRSVIHDKFKSFVEEGRRNAHPASALSRLQEEEVRDSIDGAIELRAFSGTAISHDVVVVLDVMWLAGVLKPIVDHRGVTTNMNGKSVFANRELATSALYFGANDLVDKGILRRDFARFLWGLEGDTEGVDASHVLEKFVVNFLEGIGAVVPLPVPSGSPLVGENVERSTLAAAETKVDGDDDVRRGSVDLLVITRLPIEADAEMRKNLSSARQDARHSHDSSSGGGCLRAFFRFDHAGAPHGLPERVMALSHKIGIFSPAARWRLGGLFLLDGENRSSASFMILEYDMEHKTLCIEVLGQDARCVEAMKFVISALFHVARNFPGAGWTGWMECRFNHDGQKMYHLASSHEKQSQTVGSRIIPPVRRSPSGALGKQQNLCRRQRLDPRGSCTLDADIFGEVLDVENLNTHGIL